MCEQIFLVTDPLSAPLDPLLAQAPSGVASEHFRTDLTAEWEDQKTVFAIAEKWRAAGFAVQIHELNISFPETLTKMIRSGKDEPLVHSLVEGWGSPAREGWIPAFCECLGVPWIGSSVGGMTACMDKDLVIQLAAGLGIPVPQGHLVLSSDDYHSAIKSFSGRSHFIKPNCEGSGMGVDAQSLRTREHPLTISEFQNRLRMHPDGLRVEEVLPGEELTTAIVGEGHFLPIAQIEVPGAIYGLEHKRKDVMTEKVTFPKLATSTHENLKRHSLALWNRLGLKDMARFDWKCDENGTPRLMEINPLPGLSPFYSVLPLQWAQTGRPYEDLLKTLAQSAHKKKESRALLFGRSLMRHPIETR